MLKFPRPQTDADGKLPCTVVRGEDGAEVLVALAHV